MKARIIATGGGKSGGGSLPTGFIIGLEYDTSNLVFTDAVVEADTPRTASMSSRFDLSRLR